MNVTHDGKLLIAIGRSRTAKQWQNKEMLWSEFLDKLAATTRTRETVAEYAALSKADRDNIKDVGGFAGGYLLKSGDHAQCGGLAAAGGSDQDDELLVRDIQ